MPTNDDDQRRHARAAWQGGLHHLEDLPEVEVVQGDPSELVGLVTALTLEAWALAGRPLPDYPREEMPGRLLALAIPE